MVRIEPAELRSFVSRIVAGLGGSRETADAVADSLVAADLAGHPSHGVGLIPTYAEWIDDGVIDPGASPRTALDDDGAAAVDGQHAFGQVTGRHVLDVGIPKAEAVGVAAIGIRNGSHLGRVGEWGERAAEAGLAFVGFVASPPSEVVAPPGSRAAKLSTSPICVGLPAFGAVEHPIVLDMATSQAAYGKIRDRATRDEPVPDGWATPFDGAPDAGAFLDGAGALLPLGGLTAGHKGFGLATMVELFGGTLGDAAISGQRDVSGRNVASFLLVDPLRFTTEDAIATRISAYERHVKSAEPDPDLPLGDGAMGDEVLLPGEAEHRKRAKQRERGVAVSAGDVEALRSVASEVGVEDVPDWGL